MWRKSELRLNQNRYKDLEETGAEQIAVACGFCATMLSDAAAGKEKPLPVIDLAQLVLDAVKREETKDGEFLGL